MEKKNIDYSQIYKNKYKNKMIIKRLCPQACDKSGIYIFYREENGFKYAYVGQATKSLLDRLAQHLDGKTSHIDKSIKKHGLYSQNKPYGYKVAILEFCNAQECNDREQYYIQLYASRGYQMRNTTGGSQGTGKFNINDNKPSKGYYDGLEQGRKNVVKELKHIVDKYLIVKPIKDGILPNRMLEKFYQILGGNDKCQEQQSNGLGEEPTKG